MARRARSALAALAIVLAGALLGGCGLGAGAGSRDVSLVVTDHFGATRLGAVSEPKAPGSETVMRALQRHFRVSTQYGGGFVESIDGHSGDASRLDWFFYVNGVQGKVGAAATRVHAGDRIWWDLHDWQAAESIPAVVGAFPEPFLDGISGKRYPTTLQCAGDVNPACRRVSDALGGAGVRVATQQFGTGSGTDSLSVIVATWRTLRAALVADLVRRGPSVSGIYARFAGARGDHLQLLDPAGRVVRTLGAGAGLIAATADLSGTPTWMVTGTDSAGVAAAAGALTPARLRDHFALAVDHGAYLPLPLESSR
jgi:hypothetical protein